MPDFWRLMASLKDTVQKCFCRHHTRVYEPPRLILDDPEHPYVISRSYCADCGKDLPPPYTVDRFGLTEGERLLMSYTQRHRRHGEQG